MYIIISYISLLYTLLILRFISWCDSFSRWVGFKSTRRSIRIRFCEHGAIYHHAQKADGFVFCLHSVSLVPVKTDEKVFCFEIISYFKRHVG